MGKKKESHELSPQKSKKTTVESGSEETLVGSSSNSQPVPYPQLPPIPDGSAGPSGAPDSHEAENSGIVLSKAGGDALVVESTPRDPEVLSDAPPLPGSQQATPPEPEEPPDRRRYIPPDDEWPPDWTDDRKEDTSPLSWPLDRDGWEKYLALSTKMASKKLKSDGLANAIAGSGVWDVSHPKWEYKNCWIQWHPDKIQGRIKESYKAIAASNRTPLDEALVTQIIEMANRAWISKMPGMVYKKSSSSNRVAQSPKRD